ncbi:MAG: hypothetical protein V4651_13675 [Bacteroidota bacterium]
MENNEAKKPSALWTFLNSSFGLFICSSVFITFISWSYTQVQQNNKITAEREQTIRKLITEIKYRNILLATKLDYYQYCEDSMNYDAIDQVYTVFKGDIEQLIDGKKEATDFTPIFPEYANRGLITLYWELSSLSEREPKAAIDTFEKKLVRFNLEVQRLLKADENTGAGTNMNPDDIAALDTIRKVFANHIDSTYSTFFE